MRIATIIIWMCLLCVSCEQNIDRLTSNLQALNDGADLFRANELIAFFQEDGRLIIRGSTGDGEMVFTIRTLDNENLTFGGAAHDIDIVSFTDASGTMYTTDNPDATGILDIRISADNIINGEFNFMAVSTVSGAIKTFNRGFMFNIPIGNEEVEEEVIVFNNNFEAQINTIPLDADVATSSINNGQLIISGQTSTAIVRLNLPIDTPPGTYMLLEGTDMFGSYTINTKTFFSNEGELIITLNENNLIIGSFDFMTPGGTVGGFNIVGEFTINY